MVILCWSNRLIYMSARPNRWRDSCNKSIYRALHHKTKTKRTKIWTMTKRNENGFELTVADLGNVGWERSETPHPDTLPHPDTFLKAFHWQWQIQEMLVERGVKRLIRTHFWRHATSRSLQKCMWNFWHQKLASKQLKLIMNISASALQVILTN